MDKFTVIFQPDNKRIEVEKGTTVLEAAHAAGVLINSACGGVGACRRCKVILRKGVTAEKAPSPLSPDERARGVRLACVAVVQADLEVEVPAESRLAAEQLSAREIDERLKGVYAAAEEVEVLSQASAEPALAGPALSRKVYLELPPPDLNDKLSDLERLYRQMEFSGIKVSGTSLSNIRQLGALLRTSGWRVTVTIGVRSDNTQELLSIEPSDTTRFNYGICFDIGTTTLSAQLVDLTTRQVLGTRATYNKQASFGSDVITRIIFANKQEGLEKLHRAVIDEMNLMAMELIQEHHVVTSQVNYFICAGNTTMIQLLLRVDPAYIRREPYVPTANFYPTLRACDEGLKVNQHALLGCVPGVASYVGGDVTAGVLSSGIWRRDEPCVLIDIGTNGEIVVGNKEFLITAAASAGPAFEGSGVTCGMRAQAGAIQKARIIPDEFSTTYQTIAAAPARGICGSGYIDLIAQMLQVGLIDKNGKLKELTHPRIRAGEGGREFVVVARGETDAGYDIVITEADIENLKRAKAAIYSACASLLTHVGLGIRDVHRFFIAGGFGTYLDIDSAVAIGLLPDLERSRITFIGNSSLAGARQILLSAQAMNAADELARKMTYVELSVAPGYMDEYMAALFFPHTDLEKFPSVSYKGQ